MTSPGKSRAWSLDQLAKSEFFHQKLHLWGLLEVADKIEQVKGETLAWNLGGLGISRKAWDKIIHRGIKPVTVFVHPEILTTVPRSTGYYRMLAMVSQKSMARVRLATAQYENGNATPDEQMGQAIALRLNEIMSRLIEADNAIDPREFDLWRGMAAGSQAQGSWQNTKGNRYEIVVKNILERRLAVKQLLRSEEEISQDVEALAKRFELKDGRTVVFADEPDIAIFKGQRILAAVEVKGGIDEAGILERVGAAIKSLSRAKKESRAAKTILVLQGVSVTPQAVADLKTNKKSVNHWFTIEDILDDEETRQKFFELLDV